MRKQIALLIVLVIFSLACSEPDSSNLPTDKPRNTVRVGVFLSLTGTTSSYGISALNAFKLATEEANAGGGINGRQIELVVEDDHSNAEEVASIVTKLVTRDKVHALLAEPISTRAMIAAPIAQANKIVMISPAAVKPELTQQGDFIFRACFTSPDEADVIANFAVNKLRAKRAAIIFDPKNDYAEVLARFFSDSFEKLGGEIVREENYEASDKNVFAHIKRINSEKADVLFAPGFYNTAGMVARDVKLAAGPVLIGSDGWDSKTLLEGAGDTFDGVYFANHFWIGSEDPLVRKFVDDYTRKFGAAPDAVAATAYDAARMLFEAIKRAQSVESIAVRDALAKTADFPGVTGRITLNANRDAMVPVYMLRIEKGGKISLQNEVRQAVTRPVSDSG